MLLETTLRSLYVTIISICSINTNESAYTMRVNEILRVRFLYLIKSTKSYENGHNFLYRYQMDEISILLES